MAFEYVQDIGLVPTRAIAKRKVTRGIVIHHFASEASPEAIHQDAIKRLGWAAIGYNVIAQLDGTAVWGRGLEAVGAHAGRTQSGSPDWAAAATNNSETLGIGFVGYYHPGSSLSRKEMPVAQFDLGVRLIRDSLAYFPDVEWIKGHGQMPATNTVCPGGYFPLTEMIAAARQSSSGGAAPEAPARVLLLASPMMQGEDVRWVQQRLNAAGHVPKLSEDGKFGPATDAAVRAYQAALGLTVDGKVGAQTRTALETGRPMAPIFTVTRLLKRTSPMQRGEDVRWLQERLRAAGYKLAVDGIFGDATLAAVKAYQKAKGLAVDGLAGRQTVTALGGKYGV